MFKRFLFRNTPALIGLSLSSLFSLAHAQSLLELYSSARGFDATYISAKAQYEANLARANQALGGILPNVAIQASNTRGKVNVDTLNPAYQNLATGGIAAPNPRFYNTVQGAVTLSQPLYRPALWATYRQSDAQTQAATAQYLSAEQDLLIRVTQAYFDVLNSEDNLASFKQQKSAVAEQLASAKRNFDIGTATITGVRDAQARYDLSVAQEVAAENDLRIKRLSLDLVSGLQNVQPKRLRDVTDLIATPKEDIQNWVSLAEENSPLIQQAKLNLDVAKLEVSKAYSAHGPTIDAQVATTAIHSDNGNAITAIGTQVLNPTAAIVLNVPIFSGFATQNRVKETIALEDKARADLDAAMRNTAQATRTAYYGVITGLTQVKAYQAAVASSQSSLDANKLGYSVGVNINIDVLNAQTQLYQTKRDLSKSRYDTLMAQLKLLQAVGTLNEQDLLPINALIEP
jgi:outer membrane protein